MRYLAVLALLLCPCAHCAILAIVNTDATCAGKLVASGCGVQTYGVPTETSLVRTRSGSDSDPWADPTFTWQPLAKVTKYEACTDLAAPAPMTATGGPCTTWAWFQAGGYSAKVATPSWTLYKGTSTVKPAVAYSTLDLCAAAVPRTAAATYSCRANVAVTVVKQTAPVVIGSADLKWTAPTANTDGSPLTDLSGYRVEYGPSEQSLLLSISTPATSVTVPNLTQGQWVFAVRAVTTLGMESAASNVVSKVIK